MKNKLKNIIYLPFILAGSGINFWFYIKFFLNTNYDPIAYWIISTIFTGVPAILYWQGFKKHKIRIVIGALLISIFSIFFSTAGQFADSQKKINQQVSKIESAGIQQRNLDYAWKEIERLNDEWDSLEKEKRSTIKSFDDRWTWKNTTKEIERKQDIIKTEKAKWENIVYGEKIEHTEKYASDIFDQITSNIKQKIVVMLVFQILISIIIEITAPLSFYLMSLDHDNIEADKKEIVKQQQPRTLKDYIIVYANSRFNGQDSDILKGRPVVTQETGMSQQLFLKITKLAIKKKLIKIKGKTTHATTDKETFINKMLEGSKK